MLFGPSRGQTTRRLFSLTSSPLTLSSVICKFIPRAPGFINNNNIFFSVNQCRPLRSAVPSSSTIIVNNNFGTSLSELASRVPTFVYASLVGLVLLLCAELVLSDHSRAGSSIIQFLKAPMAAGLVIPGDDVKEEEFPFPGGTTVQLYVYIVYIYIPRSPTNKITNLDAKRISPSSRSSFVTTD